MEQRMKIGNVRIKTGEKEQGKRKSYEMGINGHVIKVGLGPGRRDKRRKWTLTKTDI